ncbi:MAG TPA: spore coat protein GerQ [Firmicutes bacterium]|nr:spore coat protein GerQ [Bacillota bacterium]
MNYYYPYGPTPVDPYYGRVVNPSPSLETPYPAGMTITSETPTSATQKYFESQLNPTIEQLAQFTKNQQSYIENILRLNRGKVCAVHMTFSGEGAHKTKVFVGEIMGAARDHIILKDPNTGHNYVLLMVYLDYVDFPEEINYYYPVDGILNIVDEELYDEIPALKTLKKYNEEFEKFKIEQLKKAASEN